MLPHLLSTVPSNALRGLSQTFTKDFVCMLYKKQYIFILFCKEVLLSFQKTWDSKTHAIIYSVYY